jgi:hypothetical protein
MRGQSKALKYYNAKNAKYNDAKKSRTENERRKKSNPRIGLHIRMRIHRPNQFNLGLQLFPASLIFRLGHPLLRPIQREKNLAFAALDDPHCLP